MAGAVLAGLLLCALAFHATAAKDDLDLVSRATDGAAANSGSFIAAISGDGRFVAFTSLATNLSGDDADLVVDVFLRDVMTGTTVLVSRANGPAGAGADARSFIAAVSADGRYVAFDTNATNLSLIDDDTQADVFLRDTVVGATTLVTREDGPDGIPASGAAPSISADGRYVAFQSQDDSLSTIDDNALLNLFVRDVVGGTTTLVSRPDGVGMVPANASSFIPVISGDGRYVAFESDATNLTADVTPAIRNVFVRDLVANTTTLVSRASGPAGAVADGASTAAAISADGRRVAFQSVATNLSTEDVDPVEDIFTRDLVAGTTTLVSRATGPAGAAADAASRQAAISADGRHVAFQSVATNLSTEDVDPVEDIFTRDLVAGTTTLVSRAPGAAGPGGDAASMFAASSANGRYVAFASEADNLSALDDDTVSDIFRRDVAGLPGVPPVPPSTPTAPPVVARCAGLRATIVGTARRDNLRGTARRDVIAALAGNDLVRGLGGNDVICLGAGADRGIGGPGADRIIGGPGRDVMLGGPGRDLLLGGPGPDLLVGGTGRDLLVGGDGRDAANGGAGADVCRVESRTAC